jgi:hypothetical protein
VTDRSAPSERDERPHRFHDRLEAFEHAFEQAAIEAELETGRREETPEEIKRSLRARLFSIIGGSVVTLLGVVMLAAPGPGLVVIAVGLTILAPDVPFAARLLERVKERLPQDSDGKIPRPMIAMMIATTATFTGVSIWWSFFR